MRVRLLADDRTGAIDTAVRFVPFAGPLLVRWDFAKALSSTGNLAFDLGTRELTDACSTKLAITASELLRGADLAYLKCDSLLRGSLAQEIAACLQSQHFDHCIIAPAFPAQRRVTRNGRQWAAAQGIDEWRLVGPDLAAQLKEFGFSVHKCRSGGTAPPGVSLWDAETIQALRQIVAEGRRLPGRVLWCGTAGLAEAIAGAEPLRVETISSPLLALVGTDHPVTLRQLTRGRTLSRRFRSRRRRRHRRNRGPPRTEGCGSCDGADAGGSRPTSGGEPHRREFYKPSCRIAAARLAVGDRRRDPEPRLRGTWSRGAGGPGRDRTGYSGLGVEGRKMERREGHFQIRRFWK